MDSSMWQTTLITQVITANIVMWAMRLYIVDWVYFKIQILQEILKTPNQHQAEFCVFSEVEHLYRTVGCAEANVSISHLHRIRDHIAGGWFAYGWFTCARLVGFGHWIAENDSRMTKTNPSEHTGTRCCTPKHTQDQTSVGSECASIKCRSSSFERISPWERITVVHLRRQRSCDKDDHQRQKPYIETRVPHPASCSGLVIWQNQPGSKSLNQVCWIQKPTRRHFNKKAVSRVMSGTTCCIFLNIMNDTNIFLQPLF